MENVFKKEESSFAALNLSTANQPQGLSALLVGLCSRRIVGFWLDVMRIFSCRKEATPLTYLSFQRIALSATIVCCFALQSHAQVVSVNDFGPSATLETFTGLGLPRYNTGINSTLKLSGATYKGDYTNRLQYYDFGATFSFGEALATTVDDGTIDVVFDTPVLRAGGYMGASGGIVSFYNDSGTLLNTQTIPGHGNTSVLTFAGFQSSDLIKRISFQDTESNGRILTLDNVIRETASATPAPSALLTALIGIIPGVMLLRRRK